MGKRYPIYRAALRLYPKEYRRQYGDQMLQTVADMLDDQPEKRGRVVIWLRVGSELPLSIMRENITNVGESTMHKLALMNNKRLVGGLAAILLIVLFFTLPGWIRNTAIPKTAGIFYGRQVSKTLLEQQKNIGQPFVKIDSNLPDAKTSCAVGARSGIKTTIECASALQAYVKLPQDDAGKQQTLDAAKGIEEALRKEGYKSGSNGVTFSSLVAGTYEGKDYSPDAFYQKQVGSYNCMFDTTIAYANPDPAAIHMQILCTRTISLFGAPSQPLYPVNPDK